MRVLGIDPGIARCGWGVIDANSARLTCINYGCIETKAKEAVEKRLAVVYEKIIKIIEKYEPSDMAVEELFFNTNAKTAFLVGQARGVILLAAGQKNIPLSIYTPLQVKMAMTGYGRAEKNQIGQMVKMLLKLKEIPKPDDTADALAVGLTRAFTNKILK